MKPADTGRRTRGVRKAGRAGPADAGAAKVPAPPQWLSPAAAEVWSRARAAKPDADPDALCVYACAVADYQQAQTVLDRSGPVIQGAKGLVRNPLQSVKTANAAVVRALGRELGLIDGSEASGAKPRWRNQRGAEATIAALRTTGRLEPVDEALLALVRTIATALDRIEPDESPAALASLARVQVSAITVLRGRNDDDTDALAALLASLSAEMGDAEEA